MRKWLHTPAETSEQRKLRAIASHWKKDPDNRDIEKAFRAIDVSWSRFVPLDYLKSVINGFIFLLPNETFQELMNRVIHGKAYIDSQENTTISGAGQVLGDRGMPMDDSHFNLPTERLGLPDGGLSYLNFVAILEDTRLSRPGATLCNSSNHRIKGATYHYMTAEECLSQVNDKLIEIYRNFQEFDSEGNNIIQHRDLKKVFFRLGIPVSLEEFKQLWSRKLEVQEELNPGLRFHIRLWKPMNYS
ncbi:hypothetical protein Q9233_002477 [Columba guinea]|nr:hypothetical protein Q9233_002477 [Columba guinea]